IGSPRVGQKRDFRPRVRDDSRRRFELDAHRGDPLLELVQVLHIEAEMIDGAPLRRGELSHSRRKREVEAMEVVDLDDTRPGDALPLPGEATEHFRIPRLQRLDVRLGRMKTHVTHADGPGYCRISKSLYTQPPLCGAHRPPSPIHT